MLVGMSACEGGLVLAVSDCVQVLVGIGIFLWAGCTCTGFAYLGVCEEHM